MSTPQISLEERVIMFADVHNYSIVINSLGTNHFNFLQEVYERLGEIIVSYQGEIIKYIGDSILCIFPADSEEVAIKCAIDSRRTFSQILSEHNISSESEWEVGIGSGEVEVGTIGHESLRVKDVFGEEVNRSAMIGHHRGVAITESVYEKVRLTHKTKPLPELKVKWQEEPLKFWEVIV